MMMTMNTNRRTQKFIFSQQMESSEIQKRIIKLGNTLVKELSLKSHADTISRWMAYYIAEQMAIAKKAKGEAKIIAERQCFEAILKLWEHRSRLPAGIRPFESFDPIFRALERFDLENEQPYFYQGQDSSKKEKSGKKSDGVEEWLSIARGIDQAARIWLEYVFHQAALSAMDKKTISWLESAVSGSNRDEVSIIVRLVEAGAQDIDETNEQEQKAKREKLKSRIQKLAAFNEFSKLLLASYITELKAMESKGSLEDTGSKDKDMKKRKAKK
jgi:hypothetical protein